MVLFIIIEEACNFKSWIFAVPPYLCTITKIYSNLSNGIYTMMRDYKFVYVESQIIIQTHYISFEIYQFACSLCNRFLIA